MRKSLQIILLALLLLGTACQHEELDTGFGNDGYVEFLFTKDGDVSTRADIGEDGSGAFADGDKIGLYIEQKTGTYRHIILTRENGAWTPRLKKSDLGDGLVTLNAYYPGRDDIQNEITDGIHKHPVSNDQQAEGYEASDLLWSNKTVSAGSIPGNRIEMPFGHALHRLVVNIESKEGELPEDLAVSVRGRTQGSTYLFTGQVIPAEDSETEWIAARKLDDGRYCAVFYPQKLKQGEEWVKISTGSKESVYKFPATVGGSSSLEAGRQTTLRLTLKQNGAVEPGPEPVPGEWANSKRWVYGIKAPVCDPDEVKTYFPALESFPQGEWFKTGESLPEYLNWSPACGWYDCDKRNMFGSYPDFIEDGNLCWAAGASNLLHWWMYHNRAYIEAYDRKYGADPYPDFPRPSMTFTDQEESEIFDLFRENFANMGNWDDAAVNWFLNGTVGTLYPNDPDIESKFRGYFTDVFSGVSAATSSPMFTKEDFNRTVKEALTNRQALGFVRLTISDREFHAMVIWGAEFDEAGDVSAIYYVDNNDYYNFEGTGSTNDYQHHRVIRTPIWYNDDVWPVHMGTGKSTYIKDLTTVDLRRDIWQKAFPEVQPEDE
ncbi:IdeS/Mac family cysteine endopeptidase [Bacteroides thetaiotaomicron]|uniref:fimbrillin family protein n=1 Tax=Bacteroidaceae TaxID=815 RepID=UPI0039B4FF36